MSRRWSNGPVWSPPLPVRSNGIARRQPRTPADIRLIAVSNAASGEAGWAAPGQLVVLQGEGFAPPSQEITGGRGGVRVLFDGAAAAILQLSSKEIVAVVPYGFQGRDW